MFQSNALSSPTTYTMLVMCVLSVGFMIRFLIALAIDGKEIRVDYPVRSKDVTWEEPRSRPLTPQLTLRWKLSDWPVLSLRSPASEARAQLPTGSISPRYLSGDGNLVSQSNAVIDRASAWE
jgi:hypothetical protein